MDEKKRAWALREEQLCAEVAAVMDGYNSGERGHTQGTCIVCGERFEISGNSKIDLFCGVHVIAGLKHIGYFKDVQKAESAAA